MNRMRSFIMILYLFNVQNVSWGQHDIDSYPHDDEIQDETITGTITLPYYGGAKGQVLEVTKNPNGTITTKITKERKKPLVHLEVRPIANITNGASNGVGSGADIDPSKSFQHNLANIQRAASELIALQQNIKLTGKLSPSDQKNYVRNLEKLGISAQNLAHIQENGGQDDFRLLFENAFVNGVILGGNGSGYSGKPYDKNMKKHNKNQTQSYHHGSHLDDDVGEEDEDDDSEDNNDNDNDSVHIEIPDKDGSVAEAKPVGLAIAGVGGVASSKPMATAIVGPGGLALARPVATAFAGISPSEASQLGIGPISHRVQSQLSTKSRTPSKYGFATDGTTQNEKPTLIGPSFYLESRNNDLNKESIVSTDLNNSKAVERNIKNNNIGEDVTNTNLNIAPDSKTNILHEHAPESILPKQYPLFTSSASKLDDFIFDRSLLHHPTGLIMPEVNPYFYNMFVRNSFDQPYVDYLAGVHPHNDYK